MNTSPPVAIVTGGAGSIGTVICASLAARGYRVCVADLDPVRSAQAAARLGDGHVSFAGDLSHEETARTAVEFAATAGPVTVLVNAAGISPKSPQGKLELDEISGDDFLRVLRVNTIAPFLMAKYAARHMPADGSASIVNILSIAVRMAAGGARDAAFPPFIASASHYGASKAALHNLQVSLSRELAPRGIRVNGVAPGFIATDLNAGIPDDERARVLAQIPAGRAGTPADVAGAVAYLVSPEASYLTGAVIDVNGGWLPA
jgi:NAD(P)-dependent dehydrogenase (short-subunit alcohol dehydrogenase family)